MPRTIWQNAIDTKWNVHELPEQGQEKPLSEYDTNGNIVLYNKMLSWSFKKWICTKNGNIYIFKYVIIWVSLFLHAACMEMHQANKSGNDNTTRFRQIWLTIFFKTLVIKFISPHEYHLTKWNTRLTLPNGTRHDVIWRI